MSDIDPNLDPATLNTPDTPNTQAADDAEVAAFYTQADELAPQDGEPDERTAAHIEIMRLSEELAAAKDQTVRALAEAENTRKRAAREREDASRYAVSAFARDLLSVSDNLRRALDSMPEDDGGRGELLKGLIEGVEATERELLRTFEGKGVKPFSAMDTPFDPNFHEVMFEAPDPTKPAGTVMQVVQTGYMLHDRLLRPARVGIVKDDGQGSGGGSAAPEAGSTINTEA